jgi:hypothetical protein
VMWRPSISRPAPRHLSRRCQKWSDTMKMISAVLIALALLSLAAPVSAFDAKSFFVQQDRRSGG